MAGVAAGMYFARILRSGHRIAQMKSSGCVSSEASTPLFSVISSASDVAVSWRYFQRLVPIGNASH